TYRICKVDGSDEETAEELRDLDILTFGKTAPRIISDDGHWWLAYFNDHPVGFLGAVDSTIINGVGYFSRVGVLPVHRGHGLQLRLMRAMERHARTIWRGIVSDTSYNAHSANNFIRAGYRIFQPDLPWGYPHTIYWRKAF